MTAEQIRQYIGLRYQLGAAGPHAWDCRSLTVHLLRTYYGRHVPDLLLGDAVREQYRDHLARHSWQPVATPADGDAVLLRGGSNPHLGVWLTALGEGVLHAREGAGVMWTPASRLGMDGYPRWQALRCMEVA